LHSIQTTITSVVVHTMQCYNCLLVGIVTHINSLCHSFHIPLVLFAWALFIFLKHSLLGKS